MSASCFECKAPPPLHYHHVVPQSAGGTKTVPLCESCHSLVHGKDLRISALTRAALTYKKSQGLRVGKIPLGMRLASDGKHLEPDPVTERAVRLMVENRREELRVREQIDLCDQAVHLTARERCKLRAELVAKKKATSILATVRALNADPVAYPPRGARPWNATTIRQALERRP